MDEGGAVGWRYEARPTYRRRFGSLKTRQRKRESATVVPKQSGLGLAPMAGEGIKLESLILAQNERWRRA